MSLHDRGAPIPGPAPYSPPPPRPDRRPYVSWGITGLCVAVYLFECWRSGNFNAPDILGALNGEAVRAGEWWRIVTAAFEHANLLHLGLNMSVVLQLGTKFERAIGSTLFAAVSLLTIVGSGAAVLLLAPTVNTVGASGMILGWAGALIPVASEQFRRSLINWVVQVAILSLLPFVSWQGHLGGFVTGLACGYALRALFTARRA